MLGDKRKAANLAKYGTTRPSMRQISEANAAEKATKDLVRLFSPPGALSSYWLRRSTMEVLYKDEVVGDRRDFRVTVPSQRNHGSSGAVLAVGVLGLGAQKTDATVVVTCGAYAKAFTLHNGTAAEFKRLYQKIAEIDAGREADR